MFCDNLLQQQKIKEMEKKHRTTLEKNKRFLEKNIEVTNINRSLEEKIKRLNDDLNKLVSCHFVCFLANEITCMRGSSFY